MELIEIGNVAPPANSSLAVREGRDIYRRIVVHDEFAEGLCGIDRFRHLHVLWGVRVKPEYWVKCLTDCGEIKGVFATRSHGRPSSVGMDTVELIRVEKNALLVRGLDATPGSPVYDVKPINPMLDAIFTEEEKIEQLKQNPRKDFNQAICHEDRVRCLVKTAEIHGHFCPGSALGVMASLWGLKQLEPGFVFSEGMEDLVAVVEINACFADGIQAVSGCTLGNNALVYRDLGRHAVTFAVRGQEYGIRVRVRPEFRSHVERAVPDFFPLVAKVIKDRAGSRVDEKAFREKGREAAFALIQLPFEEILIAETVRPDLPVYAPITDSVVCIGCGESIMATKAAVHGDGRGLCLMCAGGAYRQVEGQGIVVKENLKGSTRRMGAPET